MNNQLLPIGTLLHSKAYRIERQLSSGGFGNTYVVTKTAFNETFALKEFFIRGVNTRVNEIVNVSVDANKGTFQSQKRKFTNEALRLHGVSHPNIVHVMDFFEENGTAYYVMDYIEGESLKDYMLQRKRPMTENELMPILTQLLDALSYLHSLQPALLHLDIKPANLMLTKQGQLKIIDFGASKQISMEDNLHHTLSTMCYTPGFAPTEQMEQITMLIGPWTDFYAVGATLYSLLSYKNPPSNTQITFMKEKAFQFPEGISDRMRRLIVWMMNPDISQRPQRVEEITAFLGKKEEPEESPFETLSSFRDETTEPLTEDKRLKDDDDETLEMEDIISEPPPKTFFSDSPVSRMKTYKWFSYAAAALVFVLAIVLLTNKSSEIPPLDSPEIQVEKEPFTVNGVSFDMIKVQGGTFTMGATSEAWDDEKPAHQVTLSDYSIGETEVTQALWQAVMGKNPSRFTGDANRPVECVSWDDCQEFIKKLNQMTNRKFHLPTEAEWEYAARGGTKSRGTKYAGSNDIDSVAWYEDNCVSNTTHPVKTKSPNELGLYDMSGNVFEWCQDWWGKYSSSSQSNPQGPSTGSDRINRGGSWYEDDRFSRVSGRSNDSPGKCGSDLGLRLAL